MRKIYISLMAALVCSSASAFSLKDAVSSTSVSDVVTTVVSTLVGDSAISTSSIAGTWSYSSPAVLLDSDNALTSAAGSLVTSQAESKLETLFTKAGITAGKLVFTFGSDMSFSCTVSDKTLSGTYTIDGDETMTLNFAVSSVNLGSIPTVAVISSGSLSLMFSADKLLDIVSAISSTSDSSSASAISSFASSYDGLKLGFKFSK